MRLIVLTIHAGLQDILLSCEIVRVTNSGGRGKLRDFCIRKNFNLIDLRKKSIFPTFQKKGINVTLLLPNSCNNLFIVKGLPRSVQP